MRKALFFLLLLSFLIAAKASTPPKEPLLSASEVLLPVGSTGKWISLMELSVIRIKDFEILSGKKLSFFQKVNFKLSQRKLRNQIDDDGTLCNKALRENAGEMANGNGSFHLGGFALGFLMNLYGVIISYFMKDERRKNRIKWAWIGLGTVMSLLMLIMLAMAGGKFR